MTEKREDPETNRLWEQFHATVNMTGHELRTWLLTQTSDETAFPAEPDPELPAPGREVVNVLNKRKVDLNDADLKLMATVVAQIEELRGNPPPEGVDNAGWRRALMDRGHDPLREPPEQEAAWPAA